MYLVLPQMDLAAIGWSTFMSTVMQTKGSSQWQSGICHLKKSRVIWNSVFVRSVFAKALVLWECAQNPTCHWYHSWALPRFQCVRPLVYCDTWPRLTMDKTPQFLQHSLEAGAIWSWRACLEVRNFTNWAVTCCPVATHWRPQESRAWLLISYVS